PGRWWMKCSSAAGSTARMAPAPSSRALSRSTIPSAMYASDESPRTVKGSTATRVASGAASVPPRPASQVPARTKATTVAAASAPFHHHPEREDSGGAGGRPGGVGGAAAGIPDAAAGGVVEGGGVVGGAAFEGGVG